MSGAGIAPADLPTIIDEHVFNAVWGSAFEDLLTKDLPGGRNIVDELYSGLGLLAFTGWAGASLTVDNSVTVGGTRT